MTAMLDQAAADPQQIIADLQRKLDARTAELQEKNERYALVSQAVAEGIYDWDIARNALWVSPRLIEIFGWGEPGPDAGARPSQDWNARVHPDDFEHYRAALRAALKGETPRLHCEYRIRLSDGEYRWVEDHALPVRDERGWAVRLVGAVSDVTDRKRQEQELREALDQQTATAEVLRVISGSATDVQPVFEAITARAAKLCEAEFSAVAQFEDGLLHLVAVSNLLPDEARAFHSLFPRPPTRGFVMGRAFVEGRTVHIEDVLADPDYDPRTREILQSLTGYRSFFGVPILRDGKPIGVIGCARRAVRPFTTAQIELVTTFADQAVIAIENARLFDDLRQRTDDLQESLEYQTATSDVLNVISRSTADVQPVLDTVVETAARLCGADTGNITIREGEVYRTVSNSSSAEDAEYYATLRQRRFVPGRDSVTGRVALEGRVVHIEDIRSIPDYAVPEGVASGRRTTLGVPLLREGAVLGTINLSRKRVEPFTERQIELVRTFADQAVIAMENARLLGELQTRTRDLEESLEYQTATSDVLKVISRSTADVQPVLDTVVETAARLCGNDTATILIREGEVYRWVANYGVEPEFWRALRQRTLVPGRDSVVARTALEGRVVHVADILADPDYADSESVASGRRTSLGVPLLRDGAVLGMISLARKRVEPYTERQIELVRTFADQAVIAIENARLLGELQQRTGDLQESLEYQTATSDVLQVISRSTFDLQPVLDTLVATAKRLCNADMAIIYRRVGDAYRLAANLGFPPEYEAFARTLSLAPSRASVTQRAALERRISHVADIAADPEYELPEASELGNARTALGVPLLREGEPVGVFTLARQRVEPFSEKEIALVSTFADQAVIAMENARLLGELQARTRDLEESLEYQTATSDVLQVISRSTFDLQPVLDTLVATAARLCQAEMALVHRREGEVYRMAANYGFPAEFESFLRSHPIAADHGTMAGRVALDGKVVHVADVSADPEYRLSQAITLGKQRTALGVPLLREGHPIGVIVLARTRVEPFTERQIELVRTFADQAVIAMENARLLGELQARTGDLEESLEYQTATSDVLNVISRSTSDVQPVLDTVAETACRLCGADVGAISIREGEVYRYVSAFALDAEYWPIRRQRTVVPGRETLAGRVLLEGRVVHVADILADPDYSWPENVAAGRRTILGVPLLREGAVIGTIGLARKRVEPFTERQIELVRTFADQAVIAIENARLLGELRERTRDLEESLEYQTATSDVLNVISGSSFDIQPVFDTITATAQRLCGSDDASIIMREGEVYRYVSSTSRPEYWAILRQRTVVPGRHSVAGRVALEGKVVHVADILADPDFALPESVKAGNRTVAGVPLLR